MSDGNTLSEALLCAAHDAIAIGSGAILALPDGSARHVMLQSEAGGRGRDPGASDARPPGGKTGDDPSSTPHPLDFPSKTPGEIQLRWFVGSVPWPYLKVRQHMAETLRRLRTGERCGPTGPKIPLPSKTADETE